MMLNLETVLKTLSEAPKECVYALVNQVDKRAGVYSTSNFLSHITRLVSELGSLNNKQLQEDLQKIRVLILETEFGVSRPRAFAFSRAVERFRREGYKMYRDIRTTSYKLVQGVKWRFHRYYYVLELVAGRRAPRILVGVFLKVKDARDFVDQHYKDGIIAEVVVDESELTRNWDKKARIGKE